MAIQAMILALKNNKRNRRTAFDKKAANQRSSFGELINHKKMTTYEFAAFQKKVYKEKSLQKRRRIILILITIVTVILILWMIPYVVEAIFDPSYQSVKFQN